MNFTTATNLPIRKITEVVVFFLFLAIVVLFVAASVPQLVGAEDSYVVLSDSMSPTIKAGAVVFVSDVPVDDIGTDDVITYEGESGAPVTHRVVDVVTEEGERRFVTQGDANEDPDPQPVSPSEVVGRVSFHLPIIGYVVAFAGTDLGLIALVVIPASLLVVLEIRDLLQDDDQSSDPEGKQ